MEIFSTLFSTPFASGTAGKSGVRSARAALMLAPQGLTVVGVTGSMFARQRPGGRVVAKNGRDGTVAWA
jgi:rhodanese-related sulfurtransferase